MGATTATGLRAEQELRHLAQQGDGGRLRGEGGAGALGVAGILRHRHGQLEKNVAAGALAQLGAFKRFGHPAEIAEFLVFCASDKPGYLTGTEIVCDGGVMAAMRMAAMLELARRQ